MRHPVKSMRAKNTKPPVQNDITLLLPAFQPKVSAILDAMRSRGRDPILFETYRNEERCWYLLRAGTSKNGVMSMHRFRVAVDILDKKALWADPSFFRILGEETARAHLTWGGDWDSNPKTKESFYDGPHVQAIPVKLQSEFRALANDGERNEYLARYFARVGG
jgi:hypothetical protein